MWVCEFLLVFANRSLRGSIGRKKSKVRSILCASTASSLCGRKVTSLLASLACHLIAKPQVRQVSSESASLVQSLPCSWAGPDQCKQKIGQKSKTNATPTFDATAVIILSSSWILLHRFPITSAKYLILLVHTSVLGTLCLSTYFSFHA